MVQFRTENKRAFVLSAKLVLVLKDKNRTRRYFYVHCVHSLHILSQITAFILILTAKEKTERSGGIFNYRLFVFSVNVNVTIMIWRNMYEYTYSIHINLSCYCKYWAFGNAISLKHRLIHIVVYRFKNTTHLPYIQA